jgi:hypothetical protein
VNLVKIIMTLKVIGTCCHCLYLMKSTEQKVFIIQCYGDGQVSYRYVMEQFTEKFVGIPITRMAICKLIKKFKRTGSVLDLKKKRRNTTMMMLLQS